ncbi:MAG TPA: hypothetical protein PKZ60_08280 [Candidatus Saccharicenans sp.]|nr:hypothetical protein [Candidatus Saccharicenans sp.]HPU94140.1 hypothetical protein [Candidatus Saccharicenans sp.]
MSQLEAIYFLAPAENQKEGLPLWIFYIALCLVLLLLFLTFLHNKSLRKKINDIFLVYKRRIMKFWLTAIQRRQEKKKNKLLIQLGQQGIEVWPQIKEAKQAAAINFLEEKKQSQKELGEARHSTELKDHYLTVGLIINGIRPELEQLSVYYSKLDRVERRIKILERELENL